MSTMISSSYTTHHRQLLFEGELEARKHTLRNIKSSGLSATQSWTAVHLPMPPLAAKRVHLASSEPSIAVVIVVENQKEMQAEQEREAWAVG